MGTLVKKAKDYGWHKSYKKIQDANVALEWDSVLGAKDVEPDEPEKSWDPRQDLLIFLKILFKPSEYVSYVTSDYWKDEEGKIKPGRGMTRKASDLIKELEERCGRKVIGNKSASGTEILEELAEEEIEKGNFREDLYHRLSVIVINMPSLDDRKSDIPLLVDYFIGQICSETGMAPRKIDDDALQMLVDKTWTGNIRELRNVVERLLILSGDRITASDVKAYVL